MAASSDIFRHSRRDAALVALALLHGAAALALVARARSLDGAGLLAAATLIAVGVWWSSNTISHNHLHNPLFRARGLNGAFSLYLSLLLGVPQTLWRDRHLWHHAGEPAHRLPRVAPAARREIALIALAWATLAALAPTFFLAAFLPGYLIAMALCHLQGRYEHLGAAAGISHYAPLHNRLWFNDGYHAEHHLHPREHWSRLPARRQSDARVSPQPPLLRWLDGRPMNRAQGFVLDRLEGIALRSPAIQRFMLASHQRAFLALLPALGACPARIGIVGGGLFPRTVLVLRRLFPDAALTVIDTSERHIARARAFLAERGSDEGIEFFAERFTAGRRSFDLLVLPLGYRGDREALYAAPPAAAVVIHDWLWRPRGDAGAMVSLLLLKRLNLVRAQAARSSAATAAIALTH
ncbi:MAG: hypothetical protein EXR72_18670 [Myxococcales bacterium]|nr:hypothetical protein [Myxococcales bacterium]